MKNKIFLSLKDHTLIYKVATTLNSGQRQVFKEDVGKAERVCPRGANALCFSNTFRLHERIYSRHQIGKETENDRNNQHNHTTRMMSGYAIKLIYRACMALLCRLAQPLDSFFLILGNTIAL